MTDIAVVGRSSSLPGDLATVLPGDRIFRVEDGQLADAFTAEVLIGAAPEVDLICAFLQHAERVRWLHTVSAGVDPLLVPQILERPGLIVTNNSGAFDVPIAEFVMALVFATSKRLIEHVRAQRLREWAKSAVPIELRDSTIVLVGLGSIGCEIARLAVGFGMRVIGVRRLPSLPAPPGVDRVVGPDALDEVAAEADYLAIAAALTPASRGLVSAKVLARLKPTAWVINIARGGIIDEPALLAACREHRIAGAALDAWWEEPLDRASEWWSLSNVLVTPHISQSSSPLTLRRTRDLFLQNLRRWKAGEPLVNVVDLRHGY